MTKRTFGAVALSAIALTLLSGCASVQDQIGKKVAEGIINQATGGKVNVNDQNGSITMKDEKGNEATIGGGDQRPSSAPADMPSLPGAKTFGWFGGKDGGVFSFSLPSADFKTACDQETALVTAAGWVKDDKGVTMEFAGSKTTMYKKDKASLSLTCSQSEESKDVTFALTKSVDTSTSS